MKNGPTRLAGRAAGGAGRLSRGLLGHSPQAQAGKRRAKPWPALAALGNPAGTREGRTVTIVYDAAGRIRRKTEGPVQATTYSYAPEVGGRPSTGGSARAVQATTYGDVSEGQAEGPA